MKLVYNGCYGVKKECIPVRNRLGKYRQCCGSKLGMSVMNTSIDADAYRFPGEHLQVCRY